MNVYVILWHCFDDQPVTDRTALIDLLHFVVVKFDVFYMLMILYMVSYFLFEHRNAFPDHIHDL